MAGSQPSFSQLKGPFHNHSTAHATRRGGGSRLSIRDDGIGGADPARGTGLVGLKDRVEATGGTLRVQSRPGQGTALLVELPIDTGQPSDPS